MSAEDKPKELVPDTSKMEYRYLGNSGLRVSVLSFGNWSDHEDEKKMEELIKTCLENGVNFFDTAEGYGMGKAETSLGKALKALNVPREKIVVSTKIFKGGPDPNDGFESRKHIIEGVKLSLKRLQLDYVDVVFCHRYDRGTPLEETCRAMNFVIEKGWAFYWGTSEWNADQIERAIKICEKLNLITQQQKIEYNYQRIMNNNEIFLLYFDLSYSCDNYYCGHENKIFHSSYLNFMISKFKLIWKI